MPSIHQIIHAGKEFPISYQKRKQHTGDYYFYENSYNRGIRKWNGNLKKAYRKFMVTQGSYVPQPDASIKIEALLNFWATYEADTEFELLQQNNSENYWAQPLAIHKPIAANGKPGSQYTNPYIFGERFQCIAPYQNNLTKLLPGDIVLFGSEFGGKGDVAFYLDTLLVIHDIMKINGSEFDKNFQQVVIAPLKKQENASTNYVHTGVTFANRELAGGCFSFVPCREAGRHPAGFGRPVIKNTTINKYLRNPGAYTGSKSTHIESIEKIQHLWQLIAHEVLEQGFYLGVGFEEIK